MPQAPERPSSAGGASTSSASERCVSGRAGTQRTCLIFSMREAQCPSRSLTTSGYGRNPPHLALLVRRLAPATSSSWTMNSRSVDRSRTRVAGAATHMRWPTPRVPCAQVMTLVVRRVCALPSCAHAGGQHLPSRCSSARCPATGRVGPDHSVLLGDRTTGATAVKRERLWRIESQWKPAEWWAFPGHGDAAMLNAITPPAALSGYKLTVLELHARTLPRGFLPEACDQRPAATPPR